MTILNDLRQAVLLHSASGTNYVAIKGTHLEKILAVVEAALKVKENFKDIDDGFFRGLVPPEFSPLCAPLSELEK